MVSGLLRENKKMKCPKCDYEWVTTGRRRYVACPNCFCNFIPEDEKILVQAQKRSAENHE